jgi:cholesterol transport system auxiliary component
MVRALMGRHSAALRRNRTAAEPACARRSGMGRWRWPRAAFWLGVAAVSTLLAGCGSAGPPQRDRFYALAPQVGVEPSQRAIPGTLLVMPLAARGFLGGSQIVFRTAAEPLQVQRYDQLLWEQPPGRAIAEALIAALRQSGIFQYVVSIADRAEADAIVTGELMRFAHHPTADPPHVAVQFNLTLVLRKDRSTRFSRTYTGHEPTAQSTPEAMVEAFNQVTGRLLAEAIRDLQQLAPRLPRPSTSSD